MTSAAPEIWGGVECTVNRVGDQVIDQIRMTGHHDRLSDLDQFHALGLRVLRVPLLWERIEMAPSVHDWTWADAYMARLSELEIRPIVGLVHHGSGPRWADLTTPDFATGLAAFAGLVAARYPWVRDWTPVNEPLTTARFSCLYGHWSPHQRDDKAFWNALLNQIDATAAAMTSIRTVTPDARLIQTEDFGHVTATPPCDPQAEFENLRRYMTWDLLAGRVDAAHPLRAMLDDMGHSERLDRLCDETCPADLIGMNAYVTSDRFLDHRLELHTPASHGGNGELAYADIETVRALETWRPRWGEALADLAQRYDRPVAVTECHLGCSADEQIAWLAQCWDAACAARRSGIPVEAVTVWSLLGSAGWDRLLVGPNHAYEAGVFDVSKGAPVPTPLAAFVTALAAGEAGTAPVRGWWTEPARLTLDARRTAPPPIPSEPRSLLLKDSSMAAPDPTTSVVPLRQDDTSHPAVVCFSHLRWDFVFQRPQHLMTRLAATRPVIYVEEPIFEPEAEVAFHLTPDQPGVVIVATPILPEGLSPAEVESSLRNLLDDLLSARGVHLPVLWYYTPMMLPISRHIPAGAVVYDCMDELANFRFAPASLRPLEQELIANADLVFTGGYSLFEAKQHLHADIHPFPSSVDRDHFGQARDMEVVRDDRPTFGFYGVIDERMDLGLLAAVADARPDWSIVVVGPVVKIAESELPRRPNLTYPGSAAYGDLPAILAGWDVALMPFALNESTRFISPTKTPEYLAAGRPVVSTSIRDVVRHYGDLPGVEIADSPEAFIAACEAALALARGPKAAWLPAVDGLLAELSWDQTLLRMTAQLDRVTRTRTPSAATSRAPIRRSKPRTDYDVLVVGAGFAGAVMAERLASEGGKRVLVVDRRPHIGGNAYDELDAAGLLIHRYGPHIFHTNSVEVFAYLSRFTRWRPYEHRVLAQVGDQQTPIPINRTTLNQLYGLELNTDAEAAAWLEARAEPVSPIKTSEDVVVSAVGRELYETFFRGYTRKQWGLDPSELDRSVTARVPTRTNTDDRYFTDVFQAMPLDGYTRMFERLLEHPNIEVRTGVDYREVADQVDVEHLVFTGPIDEFFDHRYGRLPYRSLRFEHATLNQPHAQAVATINYPDEATPQTRVTEYKHLTGQIHAKTSVTYEYPSAEGDPYYPVPRPENQALYKRYEALALARPDVSFVGRLATYRYYNMDQVVGQALAAYRRLSERLERPSIKSVSTAFAEPAG
ncbi:MAG: UDP-galactopyranose mutase [Brevundimonas sp.]|uniref:UDP-galactopyranose mutase n=1 Tax=Brevundimonas sp. TaxID=1871086 RepID=UPI0039188286